MLLIADSGSTKTDWVVVDGNKLFATSTVGLNPLFRTKEEMRKVYRSVNFFRGFDRKIKEVRFFGAGCGSASGKKKMEESLKAFFRNAKVKVETDLTGAALAVCGNEKGIVCILGTGSNCCYYDGKKVRQGNGGLGYILGDEASGTYFGKKILTQFLYGKLSAALAKDFKKEFHVTRESAIDHTYRQPNANSYLASFMPFVIKRKKEKEIAQLISEGLNEFFETNISTIKDYKKYGVNFVGSVALNLEESIVKMCKEKNMRLGKIMQRPIEGLEEYYLKFKV
jgi:glucosamine kinase